MHIHTIIVAYSRFFTMPVAMNMALTGGSMVVEKGKV